MARKRNQTTHVPKKEEKGRCKGKTLNPNRTETATETGKHSLQGKVSAVPVLQKSCFDFNVNASVSVCVAPPHISTFPQFSPGYPARYNCHPTADHGDSIGGGGVVIYIRQELRIDYWGSHSQSVQAGPPPVTLVRQFWSNAEIIIIKKTHTERNKRKNSH